MSTRDVTTFSNLFVLPTVYHAMLGGQLQLGLGLLLSASCSFCYHACDQRRQLDEASTESLTYPVTQAASLLVRVHFSPYLNVILTLLQL